MKSIHELEDNLYTQWRASYSTEDRAHFCFDGLCYNGPVSDDGQTASPGNEEQLWATSKRRILFLMKDTNDNDDSDYREWPWRKIHHRFFNCIFKWLQGLSTITANHVPKLQNGDYFDTPCRVVTEYPLAIVNIKKISGGSSVANNTLYEYFERDKAFLREQIVKILQPNIIVCGGGSSTVLDIAKKIYADDSFVKINYYCYYSPELNLLLIDGFHPSARVSDFWKIDDMMDKIHEFILQERPPFFE